MSSKQAIVCVDDDPMIVLLLKEQLRISFGNQFNYESATDASEALLLIDELVEDGIHIILILSDWLMPGIKGDEFIENVQNKYPGVKAIMISGQIDPQSYQELQNKCKLSAFISKPWVHEDLIHCVKKSLDE